MRPTRSTPSRLRRLPLKIHHVVTALTVAAGLLIAAAPAGAFFIQRTDGPLSGTHGIVLQPDGSFWVAEEFADSVVRLSQSGTVLRRVQLAAGSQPTSLALGPGGRLWIAANGTRKLLWIDAAAPSQIHEAPGLPPVVAASACGPREIVAGTDGRMYFSIPTDYYVPPYDLPCTGGDLVGSVAADGSDLTTTAAAGNVFDLEVWGGKLFAPDVDSGTVTRFGLGRTLVADSTVSTGAGSEPTAVAADGAGNIWATASGTGSVARFPATQVNGAAQLFPLAGGVLVYPARILAGADGRMYITGHDSANVVRVSADGSAFAFYSYPTSNPTQIINGTDGDLWFTDNYQTRIMRLVNSAPRLSGATARATAPTTAAATSLVDPRGNETQVVFDFGPTAAYGSTSSPVTVANGIGAVEASGVLTGLTPSTTYHLRARATSAEGTDVGADITFTTPVGLIDADGDRVSPPRDCNDRDPAIRPGAVDKPRDGIDQDCSGADAEYPQLLATTGLSYTVETRARFAATTVIHAITLRRLRGGERATLRCTGRRCPFKVKAYPKLKRGSRVFGAVLLRGRKLPAGTTISIRVTARGAIGRATVVRIRRRMNPKITRACLRPGATKPSRCP